MFWKTKRERDLEEQLLSLQIKANSLLKQKTHFEKEAEKFERWKKNPLEFFQEELFGLTQDELHIKDVDRPIEFDISSLSKEDQVAHLSEMSQINKSKAFRRETDAMIKDISRNIVLLDESGREVKRQLLLFIIGLRMRIGTLGAKYDAEHKPVTPTEVIRQ